MGTGESRTARRAVRRTESRVRSLVRILGADLGAARSGRQPGALRLLAARCCDLAVLTLVTYLPCRLLFLHNAGPEIVVTVTGMTVWGCLGILYAVDALALSVPDPVSGRRVIQHLEAKGWRRIAGTVRLVGLVLSVVVMASFFGGLVTGFAGLCGTILLVFALSVTYYWACWTRAGRTLGGLIFRLRLVRVDGDRLTLGDIACRLLFILFQYTGRGFAVWRLLDDVTLVETAEATVVVWE